MIVVMIMMVVMIMISMMMIMMMTVIIMIMTVIIMMMTTTITMANDEGRGHVSNDADGDDNGSDYDDDDDDDDDSSGDDSVIYLYDRKPYRFEHIVQYSAYLHRALYTTPWLPIHGPVLCVHGRYVLHPGGGGEVIITLFG
jgi:hypothetical protein